MVFVQDNMTWAPGNTVWATVAAGAVPVDYVTLDTLLQTEEWGHE